MYTIPFFMTICKESCWGSPDEAERNVNKNSSSLIRIIKVQVNSAHHTLHAQHVWGKTKLAMYTSCTYWPVAEETEYTMTLDAFNDYMSYFSSNARNWSFSIGNRHIYKGASGSHLKWLVSDHATVLRGDDAVAQSSERLSIFHLWNRVYDLR
jgi:hypothetical protein